jgi:predicted MFS family arabinose efflux permease
MSGLKRDYSELTTNWRLLLAALVGSAVGFPTLPFFSIGAFTPIFHDAFGWSQGAMLGGLMLASLMILVCGPFVGGLSYMGLAAATGSLAVYYIAWVAMCVTGLGASAISFTRAINSVFVERRGLALGIALSGSGVFALLVKPFAAWCIDEFGWRVALVAIGALPVLVAAPLVWWGFPKRWAGTKGNPAAVETGLSVKDALRSKTFWLLTVAFIGMGFGIGAPVPNIEAILHAQNLDPHAIVNAAALAGLSIILGRLVGGWLIDRMWAPVLAMIVVLCAALGCMILSQAPVTAFSASAAIALIGLAAGLEYDMLSYLVARYIGVRHYGAIYSILYGVFAIGAGGGPALLGRAYDLTGSYTMGLQICAGALVVSGVLLLLLGPYPTQFGLAKAAPRPGKGGDVD